MSDVSETSRGEKRRHLTDSPLPKETNVEDTEMDNDSKRVVIKQESVSPFAEEMDQPADLSMKKERKDAVELGRNRTHSSQPSSLLSSRTGREWYVSARDVDTTEQGVALDLASKGPSWSQTSGSDTRGDNSDEVIVLSDEEGPKVNGHVNGYSENVRSEDESGREEEDEDDDLNSLPKMLELKELTKEDLKRRDRLVMKLKENLRSEEMKLVLLKKLQLSHQMKENLVGPPPHSHSNSNKVSSNTGGGGGGGGGAGSGSSAAPPPLVRGGVGGLGGSGGHNMVGMGLHKPSSHHNSSPHQMLAPSMSRPHGSHGPPPLLMSGRMSNSGSSSLPANVLLQQGMLRGSPNMGRMPVTTPPNVVLGYPIQSQSQVQSGTVSTSSSPSLQPPQSSSRDERVDNQTPAQRQAAAKLALRKQLEKTLLQIPPPKPPPPELHFVPNPSNTEFIYLIGLEAVVNFITDGDSTKDEEAPRPFGCVQCNTDFTPVWKWENPKKGSVICELCVTSNIKKALKAEHTNRLKTAFVKALQQEQEIEQRMSQVSSSPPTPTPSHTPTPTTVVTTAPTSILHLPKMNEPMRHSHVSAAAAAAAASASANLTAAHQQLLRLPQHQPLPAHMLAPLNPFLAQAYQYQVLGKNAITSAELQRQYLLDMIPPRSLPQGTINWKT